MDFGSNKINTTIWKHINKAKEQIRSNSKPIITFDIPIQGIDMPHTMYVDYLIDRLFDVSVNENTRMEFLKKAIDKLKEKEKLVLRIYLDEIINPEKFTDFDKMEYHNKITQKDCETAEL